LGSRGSLCQSEVLPLIEMYQVLELIVN